MEKNKISIVQKQELDLLELAVKLRQEITDSNWDLNEIIQIYLQTPIVDFIKHDAALGGYVPHNHGGYVSHKNKRKKRQFLA